MPWSKRSAGHAKPKSTATPKGNFRGGVAFSNLFEHVLEPSNDPLYNPRPLRYHPTMSTPRTPIPKTYKLYIDGNFPRSESGQSLNITNTVGETVAHACNASRKDLRDAVAAARKAFTPWAQRTAYNRGQILYRMAEMLEGKRLEMIQALTITGETSNDSATRELDASIDRLVAFAGWADKHTQILGCANQVAGPYYNFSVPEPTGVTACLAPATPGLLALISLIAPPLCAGSTCVAISPATLAASTLGEVCATSDLPPGALNILTTNPSSLIEHCATHRDIDAVHAAGLSPDDTTQLRLGTAENLKRVRVHTDLTPDDWFNNDACEGPGWIEPFLETKTIWHPSSA